MSTNKKSTTSPSSPVQQSPVQQSLGDSIERPMGSDPSGAVIVDWFVGDGSSASSSDGADEADGAGTEATPAPRSPIPGKPRPTPDPRPVPSAPTYCMPPLPGKPTGGDTGPKQEPPKPTTPPAPTGPYRPPVDLPTDQTVPDIVVVLPEPTEPSSPTEPCVDDTQTPDQQGKLPTPKPPVPTDPSSPTGCRPPGAAPRDLLAFARCELDARKRELAAAESELARTQAALKAAQDAAQACAKDLESLNKRLEDVRRALGGAATPADAAALMEQLEQLTVKIRKAESQKQALLRAVKEAEAAYTLAQACQAAAKIAYESARTFLDEETRAAAERTRLIEKARTQVKVRELATEILKPPITTPGSGKGQQQQQVPPGDTSQCPAPPVEPVVTEGRAAMKAAKEWIGKVFPELLLRRAAERSVIPLNRIAERRQDERTALAALLEHMQKDLTDRVSGSRLRLVDTMSWLAEFADHAKEQLDQAIAAFKAVASAPLPSEAVLRRIFDSALKTAAQRAIELEVRRDSARAVADQKQRELDACMRGSALYAELTQRMASLAAIEQVLINASRVVDQETLIAGAPLWHRYYDDLLGSLTKAGIRAAAEPLLNQYSYLRSKVLEAEIALESPELVRRSDAELRALERERQDHLLVVDRVLLSSGNMQVIMPLVNSLNRQRVNVTLPYPADERSQIEKDIAELESKLEQAILDALKPSEVRDALRKLRALDDKLREARQLRLSVPSDIDRWEVAVPEEAWRNLWTYHEGCRRLHALSRTDVARLLNEVWVAVSAVVDATEAAGRYLRDRPLLEAVHKYRQRLVAIAEEFKASDVIAAMRGDY